MSSVHRLLGRPVRRLACSCVSRVGSHRSAGVIQLSVVSVTSLRAHLHFLLLWVTTQSSRCSFFILASTSWVHRRIQSTQGSTVVDSLSSGGVWPGVWGVLSTLHSESELSCSVLVGSVVVLVGAGRGALELTGCDPGGALELTGCDPEGVLELTGCDPGGSVELTSCA